MLENSNNLGLGLAQIHFYEEIKTYEEFKKLNFTLLFNTINKLSNMLIEYCHNEDVKEKEILYDKIRYIGLELHVMADSKLLFDVCHLLEVNDYHSSLYLNEMWHGIGTWLA